MNPAEPMSREEAVAEIKKMGKFKASKMLFFQSLSILRSDKEIVLFPVLSTIVSLVLFAILMGVFSLTGILNAQFEFADGSQLPFYGISFIFYVASFFVVTYFRVGLTAVVYARLSGGDIDFKEGMSRANQISGKIFIWSLVAGTVGIILRIISDKSQWLGKLVAGLLGVGWSIATFFIAPTLLLDNVSVWQSVKNSGNVFRKTWGETLITSVSVGLFTFVAIVLTIVFYGVLGFVLSEAGAAFFGLMIVFGLCLATILAIGVLSSCLSEIFKVALYSYARFGTIAQGFSPELIIGGVKESEKK
jgi:hypothetical protein